MNDTTDTDTHTRSRRTTSSGSWADKIWPLMVAGLITLIISIIGTVIIAGGGRIVAGGETSAVLTDRVQALLEENKEQRKLLQDILLKTSDLYTRREAQADREAAERRFQSMEGRIGDIGRRLEIVEANQRFMQQFVIESKPLSRRP